MSSYNYGRYLRDAIESVLGQSYTNFELIIVDDGSTDESPRIIEDFARRNPDRIQPILLSENQGLTASYNLALDRVSGEIVAGISSDDVWAPDAMRTWVRYFDEHPDVDVLATDFDVIGPDGRLRTGSEVLEVCPQFERFFDVDMDHLYDDLLLGNFLPDVAVVTCLRRIQVHELRYDEMCPLVSDWELMLRLAKSYRWRHLAQSTLSYRWHGENMSSPQRSVERRSDVLAQHIYVLGKELVRAPSTEHRAVILEQLSRFWSDYTAMLSAAGVDVSELPAGAAARERAQLVERLMTAEEQRSRQQSRAETLQVHVANLNDQLVRQQTHAASLAESNRHLVDRIGAFERAEIKRRRARRGWRTAFGGRSNHGEDLFDHQGLFDPAWYLATYPDVEASGMDPFAHYVHFGALEGRDPGPEFDTDFYLATYPDVAESALNPLQHFVQFGRARGRKGRTAEGSG